MFIFAVLKMIAGLLPEDKKRSIGGSVEINGVDSKDEDYTWSVSVNPAFINKWQSPQY